MLLAGGVDVPEHLGSRATFTLGGFGGHAGRALRPGDVLRLGVGAGPADRRRHAVPEDERPAFDGHWDIDVFEGPHADPEFLTPAGAAAFATATWTVHYNSARTGVRLVGPKPDWARTDGGEAGLHPSNIHDTPYGVGAVDLTGDMPVILGPDGPSLGGFVCPLTVAADQRWKLGQLRAGDTVRFHVRTADERGADSAHRPERALPAVLHRVAGDDDRPTATYRPVRRPQPARRVRRPGARPRPARAGPPADGTARGGRGSRDRRRDARASARCRSTSTATGSRSSAPSGSCGSSTTDLPDVDRVRIPSRIVHMPLSWDDPATREAIDVYMRVVRDDAPWCPSNLEFIRRVNGLDDIDAVHRTVFDASYLVLGLGDVYLGAPVATPLDPRHRLVTTKYNPARTWTPENAVGIGGAYLCIYGMEGPGGYQFVGRTVPVWSRHRPFRQTTPERPWLLRFFDQIRFHPVGADELLDLRADMVAGRGEVRVDETVFDVAGYRAWLAANDDDIATFRTRQRAAFAEERARWEASGELRRASELAEAGDDGGGPRAATPRSTPRPARPSWSPRSRPRSATCRWPKATTSRPATAWPCSRR